MIKYSIVVPLYNCEKYIYDCINSLISQNYSKEKYEIIVVNDGSTDGSSEIVKQFKGNKNLILVNKENGGLSSARNKGLSCARGEYVIFIDADDYVEENLISEIDRVNKDEDTIFYGYYNDFYEENKVISRTSMNFKYKDLHKCLSGMPVLDFLSLIGFAWNKAYRKKFLDREKIRFEEGTSLIEDILFNEKCIIKCSKYKIVQKSLVHYNQRKSHKTLSRSKYKNLDELLMRSFKKRENILRHFNDKNLSHSETLIFEFMIIYFLINDSNTILKRKEKLERFVDELYEKIDIEYISNKIVRLCIKYRLILLLILIYGVKKTR